MLFMYNYTKIAYFVSLYYTKIICYNVFYVKAVEMSVQCTNKVVHVYCCRVSSGYNLPPVSRALYGFTVKTIRDSGIWLVICFSWHLECHKSKWCFLYVIKVS